MDTPCHTLTGFIAGHALQSKEDDRPGILYCTLVSLLPDLDFFTQWFGMSYYLTFHRAVLNSVFVLPVCLFLFARVYWWFQRDTSFWTYYLFGGILAALHVFMDLWNSFGVPLLFPFSMKRFSLDLIFIIDPFIYLMLLFPVIWRFTSGNWEPRTARLSLGLIGVYLLFVILNMFLAHRHTTDFLREKSVPHSTIQKTGMIPQPLLPVRWSFIVQHDNGSDQIFFNAWTGRRFAPDDHIPSNKESMQLLRDGTIVDFDAQVFQWFARYPVILKSTDRNVIYGDLQFNNKLPEIYPDEKHYRNRDKRSTRPFPFRLQCKIRKHQPPEFTWMEDQ